MKLFRRNNYMSDNLADLIVSDVKKDLHIHTCYSDGDLTPQQVVDRWESEGYKLISITDHDGIEGSIIGMDYALGKDIMFILGIEFDSEDELGRDIHILGYGIDYNNVSFRDALYDIKMNRARRNDALMKALNDLGYEITLDDIGSINEGRYVGKPTFSLILKDKGYIDDPQEAFKSIFREPSIQNVRKVTISTKDVIDLIHEAGGLAFFAHPMEQRRVNESFEDFRPRLHVLLERMREYGVDGIECVHPSATEEQSELLSKYAKEHNLLISEGSDFHSDDQGRDFSRYHRP